MQCLQHKHTFEGCLILTLSSYNGCKLFQSECSTTLQQWTRCLWGVGGGLYLRVCVCVVVHVCVCVVVHVCVCVVVHVCVCGCTCVCVCVCVCGCTCVCVCVWLYMCVAVHVCGVVSVHFTYIIFLPVQLRQHNIRHIHHQPQQCTLHHCCLPQQLVQ